MARPWTQEEDKFIEENKGRLTYKEMSKHLKRTHRAVGQRAQCFLDRQERLDKVVSKMKQAQKEFRFKKGDKLKARRTEWTSGMHVTTTKGTVLEDNKYFVLVDTGNYKMCINKVDLYTKSVVLYKNNII